MEVYLLIINLIAFAAFGVDKWKAVHDRFRISENALFGLALLGGVGGGLAGMYYFHHKTKKRKFTIGFRVILVVWLFFLWYISGRELL